MKCNHPAFNSEFASLPCVNDATWDGRCPQHGGTVPTVPELMTLLGMLTGWDDQSLSVSIGYKRARVWTAQDYSHLDESTRGFTVGTRVCGQDRNVHAQGATLEEALWALCREVVWQTSSARDRVAKQAEKAGEALSEFIRARRVP